MIAKKVDYIKYVMVLVLGMGVLYFFKTNSIMLPAPTGKYKVGITAYHLIDAKRKEENSPNPKDLRELMVYVWYPVDEHAKGSLYPYLHDVLPYIKKDLSMGYDIGEKKLNFLDEMETHSIYGCPISKALKQYPVIFFLPGGWQIVRSYTTLLEDLASHGYIVVGIDNTYENLVTIFPNGKVIDADTVRKKYTDKELAQERKKRSEKEPDLEVRDARFVLDELERLNVYDPQGILTAKCDMNRVGICGHSWGGYNALRACKADNRFKAGMDIDGLVWKSYHSKDLNTPFMIFKAYGLYPTDEQLAQYKSTRLDDDLQRVRTLIADHAVFNNIRNDAYLAFVKGMEHFSLSDKQLLVQSHSVSAIPPLKGMAITRAVVLSFFDVYLKKTVGPQLIIDTIKRYPEICLEAKINNKIEIIVPAPTQAKKEASDKKEKSESESASALHTVVQDPLNYDAIFDTSVYEFLKFNQRMAPNDMPLWGKNLEEYDKAKEALAKVKPGSNEYKKALSNLAKIDIELKNLVNAWLDDRKLYNLVDILRRQSQEEPKKN